MFYATHHTMQLLRVHRSVTGWIMRTLTRTLAHELLAPPRYKKSHDTKSKWQMQRLCNARFVLWQQTPFVATTCLLPQTSI